MKTCFQVHPSDNVATLLGDAAAETVLVPWNDPDALIAVEPIKIGHKTAIRNIGEGDPIIKYGVRIGRATQPICVGDWVHLHNCASDYDERSGTLDGETGASGDMNYG